MTHYGLQLIDDVTGQFQYSTQFGISNDAVSSSTGYYTATITASSEGYPTPTATVTASSVYDVSSAADTTTCVNSTTTMYIPPTGTGYPHTTGGSVPGNSTMVLPSKSMTVPSSLLTSATGSATTSTGLPESTGAAGHIKAGLGMVFGVAGLAFML